MRQNGLTVSSYGIVESTECTLVEILLVGDELGVVSVISTLESTRDTTRWVKSVLDVV